MSYNISTGIYENEFEINSLITNNANAIQLIEIVNNEQQITIDNSVSDILDIETCNVIQQGLITTLQSEILDVQTCNVIQQNFIDGFNSDLTDIKTCNVIQQGLITTLQTDFSNINYDIDLLTTDDILEGTNKYSQWTTSGTQIYYNDGNVGIGIINPVHKLSVYGDDTNTTPANSGFIVGFSDKLDINGWTGIGLGGYFQTLKSGIIHERLESYGRGPLHFVNNNAASTASATISDARLTILSDGNVGIGTTDPITNLHVKEKTYIGTDVYVSSSFGPPTFSELGGQGSRLILFKGTTTEVPYSIGIENYTLWYASPFTHKWYNNTNISMTLDENGNLGIGETNPAYKLDVNGDVNITGTYKINGNDLQYSDLSNIPDNIILNELILYPPPDLTSFNWSGNTLTIANEPYGNGDYIVSSTSSYGSFYNKYVLTGENAIGGAWALNYDSSTLSYTGNDYIVDDFLGDYIKVEFPKSFVLRKSSFVARIGLRSRCPGIFKIYGSHDGSVWTEIYHQSIRLNNPEEEFLINNTISYKYYGLSVNELYSVSGTTSTILNFIKWNMYAGNVNINGDVNITGNVGIGTTIATDEITIKSQNPVISFQGGIDAVSRIEMFEAYDTFVKKLGFDIGYFGTVNTFKIRRFDNSVEPEPLDVISIIRSNGNVGIGTTAPANKLDVNGDFSVNSTTDAWSTSPNPGIYMRFNGNDDVGHIQCIKRSNVSSYPLKFYASKYNFEVGNVGIGSTNPQAKLHCQGTILTATDGDNLNNEKTNIYFCRGDRPQPLNDRHHYITSKTQGSGLSSDNFINFYIDDGTTATGTSHNKTLSITGTGVDISGSLTLTGPIYNDYQSRSLGVGTKWIRIGEYYERCNCKFTVHYAGVGVHDLLEIEVKWRFGATTKGECLIFKTCNSYVGTADYFSNIYIQNFETSYSNRRYIWVKYTTTINTSITLYAHLERYDQFSDQEAKLNDLSTVSQLTPTGGTNFTIKDGVIQTVNYNHEISDGNLTISGNVGIGTTAPPCNLTVNTEAVHKNSYNHSEAQLLLTHTATRTSSTTLNDPKKILHLSREGTSSQSYAAKASFSLSRYENNSTNSRTRLDLTLAHESYDDVNVLTVLSSGNVGIGKTNPSVKLHVNADIMSDFANGKTIQLATPGGQPGFIICGNATNNYSRFDIANHAVGTTGNRYFGMGFNGDSYPFVIRKGGNVGIGRTNPDYKLDVNGDFQCTRLVCNGDIKILGDDRKLHILDWRIYQAPPNINYNNFPWGSLSQRDLIFSYQPSNVMTDYGLSWLAFDDIYADQLDFTGQHRGVSKSQILYNKKYVGYIVSSLGQYKDLNSKYKNQNRNIRINSALPYLELSNKENDPSCFGVISDSEERDRTYHGAGRFKSSYRIDKSDKRVIINSLGEGAIWVSNYNGNIENGDYLTSSDIPGIAMRQNSEFLANYTVAKATCSVNFNNIQSYPLEKVKQEYIYTSNIKVVESNIEIIEPLSNLAYYSNADENSNVVITSNYEFFSNVIKTETINVSNLIITSNLENCLDSNGDLIYEIQYDENSNIIYESEYEIKYIKLDGTIIDYDQYDSNIHYIMCFIGCTYHCG